MNRKRKVAITASVVVLTILFFVPVIPAKVASDATPSVTPQAGWGVLIDPSGTYWFHTLNDTTYAMNLTSFQQLQNDPYSTHGMGPNCTSAIQGSLILITCPPPRCSPSHAFGGMICYPIPSATSGFDSVAYWFVHQGTVYFGGRYLWG